MWLRENGCAKRKWATGNEDSRESVLEFYRGKSPNSETELLTDGCGHEVANG
jgi:hypothetical protein